MKQHSPQRAVVCAAVLAMHGIFLAGLFTTNSMGFPPGASRQFSTVVELITLPLLPAEPPKIRPALARIHLRPPQPLAIPARSEFLADELGTREVHGQNMGPPSEVPIPEAKPQDSTQLRDLCLGGLAAPTRPASGQGTVVLLIRVESDGQVSQTTVQLSSGSTELDQAAQTCVSASLFEPRRAGLRAVPSWQRIHWNWAAAL